MSHPQETTKNFLVLACPPLRQSEMNLFNARSWPIETRGQKRSGVCVHIFSFVELVLLFIYSCNEQFFYSTFLMSSSRCICTCNGFHFYGKSSLMHWTDQMPWNEKSFLELEPFELATWPEHWRKHCNVSNQRLRPAIVKWTAIFKSKKKKKTVKKLCKTTYEAHTSSASCATEGSVAARSWSLGDHGTGSRRLDTGRACRKEKRWKDMHLKEEFKSSVMYMYVVRSNVTWEKKICVGVVFNIVMINLVLALAFQNWDVNS